MGYIALFLEYIYILTFLSLLVNDDRSTEAVFQACVGLFTIFIVAFCTFSAQQSWRIDMSSERILIVAFYTFNKTDI